MHGRRGGKGDLRRRRRHAAKEIEFVESDRPPPPHGPLDIGRGEGLLVAMLVAELEARLADGETFGQLDEAAPIGAAAKLAIGHHPQPRLLLQPHDVADAVVLYAMEFVFAQGIGGALAERLAQPRRAQQAADVIGAERRASGRGARHGGSST
jgi:hypothetical protein